MKNIRFYAIAVLFGVWIVLVNNNGGHETPDD